MQKRLLPVLALATLFAGIALEACSDGNQDSEVKPVMPDTKGTGSDGATSAVENVNAYVSLDDGALSVVAIGEADSEDAVAINPESKQVGWELRNASGAVIANGSIVDPRELRAEFDAQRAAAPIETMAPSTLAHVIIPNTGGTLVLKEDGGGPEIGRADVAPLPQGTPLASPHLEPSVIDDIRQWGRGVFRSAPSVVNSLWPQKIVDHGACGVINFLIMPDGYRSSELGTFQSDAVSLAQNVAAYAGYAEHWDKINMWTYSVASQDSGISDPGCSCPPGQAECVDCPAPAPKPKVDKNTAFGLSFGTAPTRRCIWPTRQANATVRARAALAQWYTRADIIVYLANTTEWDGCASGNTFTMSKHQGATFVLAHEAGHSLFGLADEYEYGECRAATAGRAPNTTKDVANLKWKSIVATAIEGAEYCKVGDGVYRPEQTCMMREAGSPFCAVCRARVDQVMGARASAARRNPKCDADAGVKDASVDATIDAKLTDAAPADAQSDAKPTDGGTGPSNPPPCEGKKDDDYCGNEIGWPSDKARVNCRNGKATAVYECNKRCYREWGFAYCE